MTKSLKSIFIAGVLFACSAESADIIITIDHSSGAIAKNAILEVRKNDRIVIDQLQRAFSIHRNNDGGGFGFVVGYRFQGRVLCAAGQNKAADDEHC